ncbi:NTPase KAP family P-loop domain-containing protein 1 isoform X2 [Rhineura floridana]|uniref:NTPase KAP family P-loop domain-containing protein 1 isoform X2 n=1 Tax=Rhineura floridana TaxID=261503 RepID=UPI002AC82FEE|nr:NTPase KAP family P-loop domain-containing protein 1 isoform X2 [Rhineura floridana]XP_061452944.1 NTPase KAP family P-loop domain-containing protein 1 isoform X2 [Rhineura floridana]
MQYTITCFPAVQDSIHLGTLVGDPPPAPVVMGCSNDEITRLHHSDEPPEAGSLYSREGAYFSNAEHHSMKDILTEDEIYCCSLSKTLCHTSTPVTVGFYSPCGTRLHSLLDQIAECMHKESIRREESEYQRTHERPRLPVGWNYLTLLWYLVFYEPVITEVHLRRKNIDFIFLRFSAWQYAGSDKLWAGLVTTLCDHIRHYFGPLPLSFYHVMGSKPQFASGFSQNEWRVKKKVGYTAGGLAAALAGGVALATTAYFVPGLRDGSVLQILGTAIAGVSTSGALLTIAPIIKHLIISQKKKIESMTNNEKFSSHLGFMSSVKKEIEILTNFVYYMEIFERRRLRIVFEITSLDMCYPERTIGVLNAINTLLSDINAPFIFILVVDPCIIASCLEHAGCMKGMADNGYLYLNRTVTLPFSIPEIGLRSKMRFLHEAFQSREDLMYRIITRNVEEGVKKAKGNEVALADMEASTEVDQHQIDAQAVQYIHEAFHCLHDELDSLYKYIPDSIVQMRRIVNTIPITIRLMTQQHILRYTICPRSVAAWIVLANQWPCRLSWMLQCMEDRLQNLPTQDYEKEPMWHVFTENCKELFSQHEELHNFMALDNDPELFQKFLSCDFPFSVQDGRKYLKHTVNLDHSIRHKMGQLRSLSSLEKDYSKDEANSRTV